MDPITETIDLAKVSPAKGDELIKLAFKEPFSLAKQIRITFIVGAGKLGRQKYDPALTKTLCTALGNAHFSYVGIAVTSRTLDFFCLQRPWVLIRILEQVVSIIVR